MTLPKYIVSNFIEKVLYEGKIMGHNETPQDLLCRVIYTLFEAEKAFGTKTSTIKKLSNEFAQYIVEKNVILGTPLLTNAGRYKRALSSCVVIPVDFKKIEEASAIIRSYYEQNMGAGFDLSKYENPVELLEWLNEFSVKETESGKYDRYIGNMGTLHVSHPSILEFIKAKRNKPMKHFNISIDVTEEFMLAATKGLPFSLANGKTIDASELLDIISENAWFNGDPGLIYMDRINKDNPIESIARYICTPPCAEMGLSEGETCQFGYINLASFVDELGVINYTKLEKVVRLLTRVLDNSIESSLNSYPSVASKNIANLKRKIGIGVCGLADFLLKLSKAYASVEGRVSAKNILSFINFHSKQASFELGLQRGECFSMLNKLENKYYLGFIENKYAINPTESISAEMWNKLAKEIAQSGKLRNILTTALPPTGRASLLLEASSSIEPIFSIYSHDNPQKINKSAFSFLSKQISDKNAVNKIVKESLAKGTFQSVNNLGAFEKECLKTAIEISPEFHLLMLKDLAGLVGVVDEAASKTINLPQNATISEVRCIFDLSFSLGLKNISIYRDGSHLHQPSKL